MKSAWWGSNKEDLREEEGGRQTVVLYLSRSGSGDLEGYPGMVPSLCPANASSGCSTGIHSARRFPSSSSSPASQDEGSLDRSSRLLHIPEGCVIHMCIWEDLHRVRHCTKSLPDSPQRSAGPGEEHARVQFSESSLDLRAKAV